MLTRTVESSQSGVDLIWPWVNSDNQRKKHQVFHETVGDTFNIYGQPSRKYWTESEAAKILSDWLRNLSSEISSKFQTPTQNASTSGKTGPIGIYSPLIVDFKVGGFKSLKPVVLFKPYQDRWGEGCAVRESLIQGTKFEWNHSNFGSIGCNLHAV